MQDVLEAHDRVSTQVVEAALVEIGAGFDLDRATLVMLADAEVDERLIDVMVALSYPDEFTIDRWAGPQSTSYPNPRIVSYGYDPFSYRPYGFGPYYYYYPYYPYYYYSPFGYAGWGVLRRLSVVLRLFGAAVLPGRSFESAVPAAAGPGTWSTGAATRAGGRKGPLPAA